MLRLLGGESNMFSNDYYRYGSQESLLFPVNNNMSHLKTSINIYVAPTD
jgi:hypothetical protein